MLSPNLSELFYEILSNYEYRFGRVNVFDYDRLPNYDRIIDPLYGEITLQRPILYLLSLSIVERLRRIRQLALTDLVYVGATHTRLEHSLGVSYLLTNIPKDLGEIDKVILNIAGLLHDIGHSGWGHALDGVVAKVVSEISKMEESFPRFAPKKLDMTITSYLLYHNDQLVNALATIAEHSEHTWNRLSFKTEPKMFRDIVAWIISEEENGHFFCKGEYWQEIPDTVVKRIRYFQRLLGRDVNCDRIDWIGRDGHHAFHSITKYSKLFDGIKKARKKVTTEQGETDNASVIGDFEKLNNMQSRLREVLYREVYEGVHRSFIDSLLTRLVYSSISVLSCVGDRVASPSSKARVIMGYIFLPDEELAYYTERVLRGAYFCAPEALGMRPHLAEFIHASYVLLESFFKNMRAVLSIIANVGNTLSAGKMLTSKKVGQMVIDSHQYSIMHVDSHWLLAKVLNLQGLQLAIKSSGRTKNQLWHILNEFFVHLRTDVVSSMELENVEYEINKRVVEEKGETRVYVMPNYYFLRRLTDELSDFSMKSSFSEREIFFEFADLLIEKYQGLPFCFIVIRGDETEKVIEIAEDTLAKHVSRLIIERLVS